MSALSQVDNWFDRASCRGCPIEMFFPEGGSGGPAVRELCRSCPVRQECFEYAMAIPQDEDRCGIFAGTSAKERRRARLARLRGQEATLETIRVRERKPILLRWNPETGKYQTVRTKVR